MILTTTLNSSVDISYKLSPFTIDGINRVDNVSKTAGGKGLNVARVLNQLGENVAATGFLGGSLGMFIRNQLHELGIEDLFINIDGETRNCIAIVHDGNKQTEILESGPVIRKEEASKFINEFRQFVGRFEYVTVSGSLPKGLTSSIYKELIQVANASNIPVLLDTNGKLLAEVLEAHDKPYLIKPNQDELSELIGKSIDTETDLIDALNNPLFNDIPWVVVTLGSDGALIKFDNGYYRARIPTVKAINPVGSGDSVIAGFVAGLRRGLKPKQLIQFGLSLGVLNAMEEKTGFVNVEQIDSVSNKISVEQIQIQSV